MSYKQTNIKDWENEEILDWIKSIDLSEKWTEKITEIITESECTGTDLLSLNNSKELDESFGLNNPMLSNRLFRELKKIKTVLPSSEFEVITVDLQATAGGHGYPQEIIDDWSEYRSMLTNIGFIDIPPSISPPQAHQTWIKMLICVNKKTNNTPSAIRNREEIIEILTEDGFYMNHTNWFDTHCPPVMPVEIEQENKEFHDMPQPNAANIYENGLCGNAFIRTVYIASSLCLVSMLLFGVWFATPISAEFKAGYGLSAFANTILCAASIITLVSTLSAKMGKTIPREKWVKWSTIWLYCIGGLFYFFGACGIAHAWNSVDGSSVAGIYFAEQTFVGLHGMLAGFDLYEMKILNEKKWRIVIYNALFLFLALIDFFSFAVLSATFDEFGVDNGAIAFVATFYFLVMIPPICFLILYVMPSRQQMRTKPIVLYVLTGSFVFCVVCILIGYFVLTAEFQGYFLGDRIGIFMLLTAMLIVSDMLFDHLLNGPIAAQNYQGLPNQT